VTSVIWRLCFVSSPGPIIFIAVLTIRTLALRRAAANIQQRASCADHHCCHLSTPAILAIVNVKFIVCSLPYAVAFVFLIIAELWHIRWLKRAQVSVGCVRRTCAPCARMFRWMMAADFANFLVLVQSATNWPLFIQYRTHTGHQQQLHYSTSMYAQT
jgi:hypothetical protein